MPEISVNCPDPEVVVPNEAEISLSHPLDVCKLTQYLDVPNSPTRVVDFGIINLAQFTENNLRLLAMGWFNVGVGQLFVIGVVTTLL